MGTKPSNRDCNKSQWPNTVTTHSNITTERNNATKHRNNTTHQNNRTNHNRTNTNDDSLQTTERIRRTIRQQPTKLVSPTTSKGASGNFTKHHKRIEQQLGLVLPCLQG